MIVKLAGAAAAVLVVSLLLRFVFARPFLALERQFNRVSRRRTIAVALVAVAALGGRLLLLPRLPIPLPLAHDEFSHLVGADTFAHGRLANPTHPMWVHLESFHIIWKPSNQTMYQPAPALAMAAGQVLFGHPWFGVWASVGLMCAAVCWMLQGWFPPRWALAGALLVLIRFAFIGDVVNSYVRAPLAAAGGALVLGALPRLLRHGRARDGLVMGAGLVLLVNTRPFEGLAVSIPVAAVLALALFRRKLRVRAAAVLVLTLTAGAALTCFYNWHVTGDPLLAPYALNRSTYGIGKNFFWLEPNPPPSYNHPVMERNYLIQLNSYHAARARPLWLHAVDRARMIAETYWGPAVTLAVLWAPAAWAVRRRFAQPRFFFAAFAFSFAALLSETWLLSHYPAPMLALTAALAVAGLRQWSVFGRRRRIGFWMARAVPVVCVVLLANGIRAELVRNQPAGDLGRAAVADRIAREPGKHLLVVRYSSDHHPHREWVYNGADVDQSRLVWAREMPDAARNRELVDYFRDRTAWLIEPDREPPGIAPYPRP